ncbi:Uncharacterised protein [Mycobacteroides abscessus subsp. abscessus]|nr:Uncharacterised protein [Mycobacteroides abscessus subsp. abscessus]
MVTAISTPKLGPDITLIGGSARVGKTTLARRWVSAHPSELVHLDHLLHALTAIADAEALTSLRKAPSITTHTPGQWLSELRDRDAILWKAAHAYAGAAQGQLVIEGGLWPDWLRQLDVPHTAIFIVDTSEDSAERLVQMTRQDPRSWIAQRRWPDDKIRSWATYNRFRSQAISDLAIQYGYPVFDVAGSISEGQERALRYLAAA